MNRHFYTLFLVIALVIIGTIVGNMSKRGNNSINIEDYALPADALNTISERNIDFVVNTKEPSTNPMVRSLAATLKEQGITQAANVNYILTDGSFIDVRTYVMQDANSVTTFYQQSKDGLAAEGVDYQENFGIGAQAMFAHRDSGTIIRFYDETITTTIHALSDDEDGLIAFARAYREWVQAQLAK